MPRPWKKSNRRLSAGLMMLRYMRGEKNGPFCSPYVVQERRVEAIPLRHHDLRHLDHHICLRSTMSCTQSEASISSGSSMSERM